MSLQFVLVDVSNGAKTGNGESLTPELLAMAARVLDVYLGRHVGAYWGLPGGAMCRAASSPSDILPNEWPEYIQPTLPDAPDAIAYHTVNGVGVPALYDGLTLSSSLFGPGGWLSATAHEFAETVGDAGTNILCADNLGKLFARELCDPLETQDYPITIGADGSLWATPSTMPGLASDGSFTAYVSNFVTEGFFIPNHQGPYDFMTAAGLAAANGPAGPFQNRAVGRGQLPDLGAGPPGRAAVVRGEGADQGPRPHRRRLDPLRSGHGPRQSVRIPGGEEGALHVAIAPSRRPRAGRRLMPVPPALHDLGKALLRAGGRALGRAGAAIVDGGLADADELIETAKAAAKLAQKELRAMRARVPKPPPPPHDVDDE